MYKKNKNNLFFIGAIIFFIGLNIYNFLVQIVGNDYWWHIKAGEYIVTNKIIPFTDVFSWYGVSAKLYWYSHEWLTEVLFYLVEKPFGDFGMYLFTLLLCFGLQLFLIITNKANLSKNKIFSIIWLSIGVMILNIVIMPRPHMISFILLAITIQILFKFLSNENSKSIWFIPVISMLWANFHGGSSNLPYILVFIFLFVGLFDFNLFKLENKKLSKRHIKKLFMVGILSILALIINPHGLDIITYPYINMQDTFMLTFISEWRSPDLKNSYDIVVYVLIFIVGIAFVLTDKKIKAIDLVLALAFTYLTCKSIRFSIFLYIVATYIVFNYVDNFNIKKKYEKYLGLILMMVGITLSSNLMCLKAISEVPILTTLSDEMVEEVKELNPKRLYNDYDFGGYLIYNDIPVFVDGRADMYSAYNLQDAINLMSLKIVGTPSHKVSFDAQEIINKYDFDAFLIQKIRPLNSYLKNDDKYEVVFEDSYTILYKVKE